MPKIPRVTATGDQITVSEPKGSVVTRELEALRKALAEAEAFAHTPRGGEEWWIRRSELIGAIFSAKKARRG